MRRCRGKTEKKQQTQAEEELTAKGKMWISFAAAAVAAFCIFSGQYFSIGMEADDDLVDDDDDEL